MSVTMWRRWFLSAWLFVFLLALSSLSGSVKKAKLRALFLRNTHLVQEGDWVFRSGVSADSRLIKSLSQSRFSHVGIVVQTRPQILVAHATTDDDPEFPNQVLITSLDDFSSVKHADALVVARPRFLNAGQRAAAARHAAARKGQAFVMTAQANKPFYCTILLLNAIQEQEPAFQPVWEYLDVPVFRGKYLFPEALLRADLEWVDTSVAVMH